MCASKIAITRAEQVAEVMRWSRAQGGSAAMLTLTMQHHAGMTLKQCWDGLGDAWGKVTSGRGWIHDQQQLGIVGWLRVVEVTYGENGWHVHVHALVVFDRPISDTILDSFAESAWGRWNGALTKHGLYSLLHDKDGKRVGVDIRPVRDSDGDKVGRYFAKLALEVTGGTYKKGRKGGKTPFELLHYGLDTGDAEAFAKWAEWEQASKGRKQLSWSQGRSDLRKLVGLADQSDEEIAEEEVGDDDLLILPAETWRAVRDIAWVLLDQVEDHGLDGLTRWLDRFGLAYQPPQKVSRYRDRADRYGNNAV